MRLDRGPVSRGDLLVQPGGKAIQVEGAKILAGPIPDGDLPVLDLPIADDQEIGDPLQGVLAG